MMWGSDCVGLESPCLASQRTARKNTLGLSVMLCHFSAEKILSGFPPQASAAGRAAVVMTRGPPREEGSPWLSSQRCLWMLVREDEKRPVVPGKDQIKKKAAWKYVSTWVVLSLLLHWEENCGPSQVKKCGFPLFPWSWMIKNSILRVGPVWSQIILETWSFLHVQKQLRVWNKKISAYSYFYEVIILLVWSNNTIMCGRVL